MASQSRETFEKGQIVRLNSGGPNMTVQDIYDNGSLECSWFDAKGDRRVETFDPAAVKLAQTQQMPKQVRIKI